MNDIQVSGLTNFPEDQWREAVLHYLFGVWADKQEVMYRPKIHFGDICLRLDVATGKYYAYGTSDEEVPSGFTDEETLQVRGGGQAEVETSLIRFVKNNRIKMLILWLPLSEGFVALWKKSRRGQYGCSATGIPKAWGVNGAIR